MRNKYYLIAFSCNNTNYWATSIKGISEIDIVQLIESKDILKQQSWFQEGAQDVQMASLQKALLSKQIKHFQLRVTLKKIDILGKEQEKLLSLRNSKNKRGIQFLSFCFSLSTSLLLFFLHVFYSCQHTYDFP